MVPQPLWSNSLARLSIISFLPGFGYALWCDKTKKKNTKAAKAMEICKSCWNLIHSLHFASVGHFADLQLKKSSLWEIDSCKSNRKYQSARRWEYVTTGTLALFEDVTITLSSELKDLLAAFKIPYSPCKKVKGNLVCRIMLGFYKQTMHMGVPIKHIPMKQITLTPCMSLLAISKRTELESCAPSQIEEKW